MRASCLRCLLTFCLMTSLFTATFARPASTPLTIDAEPLLQTITSGKTQEYTVSLTGGQFVAVTVIQQDEFDVALEILRPDGTSLTTVDASPVSFLPEETSFTAPLEGIYRIVIRPVNADTSGKYTVEVKSAHRYAAFKAGLTSPRLQKLWEEVRDDTTGGKAAVEAFIKERKEAKSLLIEPIPGNDREVLLTFAYLGDDNTRSVRLVNAPTPQAEAPMERFAATNLWVFSAQAPKDTRLAYCFVVRQATSLMADGKTSLLFSDVPVPDILSPTRDLSDPSLSTVILPDAPAELYNHPSPAGTPQGKVESGSMQSAILKEKRDFFVYTPPDYDPKRKEKYGLVVCFDGELWCLGFPSYGDNMIAAKKLPPVIGVFVHTHGRRQRDLACYTHFADFLTKELLPEIRKRYPSATSDPKKTIVYGFSLGGLCAAYCGLTHPETFGNVLSLSGSFWYAPDIEKITIETISFHEGMIPAAFAKRERLPVRFYLEIGTYEGLAMLYTNRNLRDILKLKGYDVTYNEFHGVHDIESWIPAFANGLTKLTEGWK